MKISIVGSGNLASHIIPRLLKKGIKVVSNPGKSPYLNGHFTAVGVAT